MSEQFKDAINSWVTLKKQLASVRADVKILNTQERQLKGFIQTFMREQKIDACTVSEHNAKVTLISRKVRSTFNRALVRKGLVKYFRGDESLVEKVLDLIDEEAEEQERDSVSLKNLKV